MKSASQYRVDLDRLMQIYAANYLLFCRLFPVKLSVGESIRLHSEALQSGVGDYSVVLVSREQTRYTSLIEVQQNISTVLPNLATPHMLVRLYHDARLAEVCASQQIFRLKPRYDYPNKKMHQRDEKQQVNLFLHDWLKYCLQHRVTMYSPIPKGSESTE